MAYYSATIDLKTAGGTDPSGTTGPAEAPVTSTIPQQSPVAAWLMTPQARRFAGQWVLLDGVLEPIDSDLSPQALERRHLDSAGGAVIVFVRPSAMQLGR